jgi:hypothetical protein
MRFDGADDLWLAVVGNEPDQYSNGSRNLATWGPEAYTAEFLVRVYSSSSRPSSRCSLISLHPFLLLRFPVLVDEPHFEPQFARSILPSWSVWFVLSCSTSPSLSASCYRHLFPSRTFRFQLWTQTRRLRLLPRTSSTSASPTRPSFRPSPNVGPAFQSPSSNPSLPLPSPS